MTTEPDIDPREEHLRQIVSQMGEAPIDDTFAACVGGLQLIEYQRRALAYAAREIDILRRELRAACDQAKRGA
jgi:hypothetical protein